MLKFSPVAVALSFVLVAAAGCGTGGGNGTTTGLQTCSPACGVNQTCNTDLTCSCYQNTHECPVDADAGTAGDAGSQDGGNAQGFVCVKFELDNNNCGGCGVVCGAGQACLNGICSCQLTQCISDAGVTSCSDNQKDSQNCGACGNKCSVGETCTNGRCQCTTSSTIAECQTDAGEQCVDLTSDNNNCGGCGNVCAGNQHCAAPGGGTGVCICDDGGPGTDIENCNGSCTDTVKDPFNCGNCNTVCVSGSCSAPDAGEGGSCNCPPPYTQCGPDCVDTFSDIYHCGKCDVDCTIEGSGISELACNLGKCFCGPTSQGTICIDPAGTVCSKLSTDPQNCGICGNICTPPAQDCSNGTCVCPDGDALCGSPDAGIPLFCINTTQNDQNCGTCANVCDTTFAANSGCRFGICTCSPGQTTLCADTPANPVTPTCTCVSDSSSPSGTPCSVPSFNTDIYPLLAQQSGSFGCSASGCHTGTNPAGGLPFLDQNGNMDAGMAYAALLGTSGVFSFGDGGIPFCDGGVPSNGPSEVCACVSRVTPNSIFSSYLVDVLANDLPCEPGHLPDGGLTDGGGCASCGSLMPIDGDGGWRPLSLCEVTLIEQWISSGANQ